MEDNPVNYVDPTGQIKESEAKDADQILNELKVNYNVDIQKDYGWNDYGYGGCWNPGAWANLDELLWTKEAINDVANAMEGRTHFMILFKNEPIHITRTPDSGGGRSWAPLPPILSSMFGDVNLVGNKFDDELSLKHTVAHELGHIWDYRNNFRLSNGMEKLLGTEICSSGYGYKSDCRFDVTAGKERWVGNPNNPYPNDYNHLPLPQNIEGPWEDWADSFAVYVNDAYYKSQGYNVLGPIRRQYIYDQIHDWE